MSNLSFSKAFSTLQKTYKSRVYFLQFKKIEISKRYTLPTARKRKKKDM